MIQTGPVNSLGRLFNEWENRIDCADGRLVAGVRTGVFQHATDHVASGNHCDPLCQVNARPLRGSSRLGSETEDQNSSTPWICGGIPCTT